MLSCANGYTFLRKWTQVNRQHLKGSRVTKTVVRIVPELNPSPPPKIGGGEGLRVAGAL